MLILIPGLTENDGLQSCFGQLQAGQRPVVNKMGKPACPDIPFLIVVISGGNQFDFLPVFRQTIVIKPVDNRLNLGSCCNYSNI